MIHEIQALAASLVDVLTYHLIWLKILQKTWLPAAEKISAANNIKSEYAYIV